MNAQMMRKNMNLLKRSIVSIVHDGPNPADPTNFAFFFFLVFVLLYVCIGTPTLTHLSLTIHSLTFSHAHTHSNLPIEVRFVLYACVYIMLNMPVYDVNTSKQLMMFEG